MKSVRLWVVFLVLALASGVRADSMFELPQGNWYVVEPKHFTYTHTFTVQVDANGAMRWTYWENSGDSDNGIVADGTYRVSAMKSADWHATFWVHELHHYRYMGKSERPEEAHMLDLTVHPGDEIRFSFTHQEDGTIQFTVFDANIQPVFTRILRPR